MIKILIADDHQMFTEGLVELLKDSGEAIEIIDVVSDGDSALDVLKRREIDVVILDISMPGMDGAQTLKAIRKNHPAAKVLMLTMHNDADRIVMMLQNEAHGYVLKNRSGKEVIDAIKTLASGGLYYPDEIQKLAFKSLIPKGFLKDEINRIRFTEKEEEILTLLAQGDQVKAIAEKLFVSPKTIESHKTSLMKKIGARNVQDVVRFAVKNGYCPD